MINSMNISRFEMKASSSWIAIALLVTLGVTAGYGQDGRVERSVKQQAFQLPIEERLLTMIFPSLVTEYIDSDNNLLKSVLLDEICKMQFVYFLQIRDNKVVSVEYLDILVGRADYRLRKDDSYAARVADPWPLMSLGGSQRTEAERKQIVEEFERFLDARKKGYLRARGHNGE